MQLLGQNFVGGNVSGTGDVKFTASNPATGEKLEPLFHEAAPGEIDAAFEAARLAFEEVRSLPAERIALFLEAMADAIVALGDDLIDRANLETALPEQRLLGERGRTVGQIRMFAELIREGSWVEATIDRAIPDRKPLPKPDLRRMLIPIGPVVIFGASNFPLAFSVAGGDTASALAARNPVIVKAHPAHPGTSELVATAITSALKKCGLPAGMFSMLHGARHDVGLALVRHRHAKAVGFTGSLQGGRALFDAAASRPEPIPVYAEMGSTNPVFILPGALAKNVDNLAEGLVQSVTMGVGQFCTNPGIVVGLAGNSLSDLIERAGQLAAASAAGSMLYESIGTRFSQNVDQAASIPGVRIAGRCSASGAKSGAVVLTTTAETFLRHAALREENFGPSTIIVSCNTPSELENIARAMEGQLTATIHGTEDDLANNQRLVSILQQKAGRLLFNGFPTGVEVCPSMHHGGPYPATTDPRSTSVGTAAIKRFARPICFQNFPEAALPVELRANNERNIWRLVDAKWTRDRF